VRRDVRDAGLRGALLEHVVDGDGAQAVAVDRSDLRDREEELAGVVAAVGELGGEGRAGGGGQRHQALLVALAVADAQRGRVRRVVGHVEVYQLGAPHPSDVEDGQDRGVARAGRARVAAAGLDEGLELAAGHGAAGREPGATSALDLGDAAVLLVGQQVLVAGLLEHAAQRGQRQVDRRRRPRLLGQRVLLAQAAADIAEVVGAQFVPGHRGGIDPDQPRHRRQVLLHDRLTLRRKRRQVGSQRVDEWSRRERIGEQPHRRHQGRVVAHGSYPFVRATHRR